MDKRYLRLGTAVSDNSRPMLSKIFQLLFVLFFLRRWGGGGGGVSDSLWGGELSNFQTRLRGSKTKEMNY